MVSNLTVKIGADINNLQKELKKATGTLDGFSKNIKGIGLGIGAAFGLSQLKDVGAQIVNTTAKYQKFAAVLQNNLGSRSGATDALNDLKEFATKTPFQVDELTASFIKLNGQGFKPTMDQMRALGDLAASQGKSFNQLSEAVLDAMTGENERLKEFGVKAKKSGDQVTYTFKGVSTTVQNTSAAIKDYLLSLGNMAGVSGSMAAISTTLEGKLSNIGDNIDQILGGLGNKTSGLIGGFLDLTNNVLGSLNKALNDQVAALREEQTELNVLVGAITAVNTPTEVRKKLIEELNQKYPDFLKNLDAEKVTNEQLSSRLKDVNEQFMRKIALQTAEERFKDAQEKILDLIDKEIEQRKHLEKIKRGEITFRDDLKDGWSAELKRKMETARWEGMIADTQEERATIQAELNAKLNEYNAALGLFNETSNDYFTGTVNNTTATNAFAASLDNLKKKLNFKVKTPAGGGPLPGANEFGGNGDMDTKNMFLTDDELNNPVPGLVEQEKANDALTASLEGLAEARLAEREAMRKSMETAQEWGSIIGNSFGEAASGQKSWADALRSLLPQVLRLLLAEATAAMITAGAKDGAKKGNVILGLAAASLGAAAIGSMFSGIDSGSSSSPSSVSSGSRGSTYDPTGSLSGDGLQIQVGGEFRIQGNDLVYIFNRQQSLNGRTRG